MIEGLLPLSTLVILALVAHRVTRFFVFDSLMGFNLVSESKTSERLDRWAYFGPEDAPLPENVENGDDRTWLRGKIGDLLTCPYCLGFWISLCVYGIVSGALGWDAPLAASVLNVFAIAGLQIIAAAVLD